MVKMKVSIIMPYYKKSSYVDETVNSILNQTFKEFEIIIVDDELSEDSSKVLSRIKQLDKRINIIKNKKNLGAGQSRNNAINLCNGEYIAFCDCDDLWKSHKLETQLKIMHKLNLEFSHTSYEIIDKKNSKIGYREAQENLSFLQLQKSCDIGLSTVILKKNLFDNQKFRFGEIKTKEDYILWLSLAKKNIMIFGIKDCLVSWRKSKDSLSSSTFQKFYDGYKVYKDHLNYSRIKSLYFLFVLSLNFILKRFK